MKKDIFMRARMAGILVAMVLLASCYALLANQEGALNLSISRGALIPPALANCEVIVMVVDAGYQAALAETLFLISKGHNSSLSSSEQDRLTTLGKQLATNGLVKFGGYPFYQTDIIGSTGTFNIPGVPAGRSYFVKILVFNPGVTFDVKNLDQHIGNLIQGENYAFNSNDSYLTPFQNWQPNAGQPVTVNVSQNAPLSVTLYAGVP